MVSILFIFNWDTLTYWEITLGHRTRGGVARRDIRWAFAFVAEVFHVLVWTAFVFLPERYHGSGVWTLHLLVNSAFFSFVALFSVVDTGVCGDAVGCVVEPPTVSLFYKHQIRNVTYPDVVSIQVEQAGNSGSCQLYRSVCSNSKELWCRHHSKSHYGPQLLPILYVGLPPARGLGW